MPYPRDQSQIFRIIAHQLASKTCGHRKSVTSARRVKIQQAILVIAAGADFGPDHLQCENERLYRVNAPGVFDRFLIRPADFVSTGPRLFALLLWGERIELQTNVSCRY
jgi:hypothetical protein